jgi:hypothetical protein
VVVVDVELVVVELVLDVEEEVVLVLADMEVEVSVINSGPVVDGTSVVGMISMVLGSSVEVSSPAPPDLTMAATSTTTMHAMPAPIAGDRNLRLEKG